MMEEKNKLVQDLEERNRELLARITEFRKKGYDVTVAALMAKNVPAKIQMVSVTMAQSDIDKVNLLFDEVNKEIDSIEKPKTLSEVAESVHFKEAERVKFRVAEVLGEKFPVKEHGVEKEEEGKEGGRQREETGEEEEEEIINSDIEIAQSHADILNVTNNLIKDAYLKLDEKNYEEARWIYQKITGLYGSMPADLRKQIYTQCAELHSRIKR